MAEFLNKGIYQFINEKGIELLPCPPYVHQLDGVAERFNRSAMDIGTVFVHRKNVCLICS